MTLFSCHWGGLDAVQGASRSRSAAWPGEEDVEEVEEEKRER